jgi:mRNA interferase RelE/StbE
MAKTQVLYELRQHPSVRKQLKSIPSETRIRIQKKIESLAQDPRPRTCKKILIADAYRLRVGDYRIIYQIDDKNRIVSVKAVGPRRTIYR